MERGHDEMILHLPGTAEEKQWLSDHLETLSVRERIVLSAAMAREPPKDMTETVNCLLSLDEYEVRGHVGNYAALGEFFLFDRCVPQDQQACFDLTALGYAYECQRQFEIVRKRRRNFVVFRRGGGVTKQSVSLLKKRVQVLVFLALNFLSLLQALKLRFDF